VDLTELKLWLKTKASAEPKIRFQTNAETNSGTELNLKLKSVLN